MPAVLNQRVRFAGREWRVIDLSQTLSNETTSVEVLPHQIEYFDHRATAAIAQQRWGIDAAAWRDGYAWAHERVTLSTHSGTHVDAPYHYHPTSAGRPARTVDDLPLQWLMGDGVVLDVTGCDRHAGITENDVRAALERIGYELKPLDVVLLRTDVSERFDEPGYDLLHPGLRVGATAWLVERGVRLIGIDSWGIDRPFDIMAQEARAGVSEQLWESHKFGADHEYCQIEKLCNLAALPRPFGFCVLALPISIEAASGGWARVVALVPEEEER
jgi:kynurenine formamidase